MGALNPKRAAFYAECYGAWKDPQEPAWLLRLVSNNDVTVTVTTFTMTTLTPITTSSITTVIMSTINRTNYHDHDYHYHAHSTNYSIVTI